MNKTLTALAAICLSLTACSAKASDQKTDNQPSEPTDTIMTPQKDARVVISTTEGDIEVLLYGDTPLHQANFLKLAREGYYDGTLFHRVINQFMVQAGDPDSRNAQPGQRLGSGGPGYQIPAEFVYPKHFHKAGALSAARMGDEVNPERKSSGSQFYIVTGQVYTPAQISNMEKQMQQGEIQRLFYQLSNARSAEIYAMRQQGDEQGLMNLQDELIAQATEQAKQNLPGFTPEMIEAYTTVGGTPHLDAQYTVFGEVTKGMDIVHKIEQAQTDAADRPLTDIRITGMKVVE